MSGLGVSPRGRALILSRSGDHMTATGQHRSHHGRPRVVVTGRFRLVVETIGRSLAPAARIVPIPLETCASMSGARDAVLRAKAELVVIVAADAVDAHDLVADLAARGQRVVVVSQPGDRAESAELVGAGAVAVLGSGGVAEVRELVDRVARTPGAAPHPATHAPVPDRALTAERRARRNLGRLTPAEARILWRLMHGSSVAEIAQAHVVSVETVRSQIRALLAKLEAGSQLAAVALAWRVGWTPATTAVPAA